MGSVGLVSMNGMSIIFQVIATRYGVSSSSRGSYPVWKLMDAACLRSRLLQRAFKYEQRSLGQLFTIVKNLFLKIGSFHPIVTIHRWSLAHQEKCWRRMSGKHLHAFIWRSSETGA